MKHSRAVKKYAGMASLSIFSVHVTLVIMHAIAGALASVYAAVTPFSVTQYAGVFTTMIMLLLPSGAIGAVFLLSPRGDWKVFSGMCVFAHGTLISYTAPLYPAVTDFNIWAFIVFNGIFEIAVLATAAHAVYKYWKTKRSKTYAIG